ncbi:MAG: FadR family transcriptional regulator [Alphaproteobacteria bacterium]|nr:FadR family transcriptional regulator [Alphaproteobacteria bacterium]
MATQGLTESVARLRALVEDGAYLDSGRLPPERTLADDLGVGRRSLRRALDVLEREGRISREQGRGTFVRNVTATPPTTLASIDEHTSPSEVIELRLTFEPMIARLAAMRATACDIRKLQRLAAQTCEAAAADDYERADAAFHRAVVEAAHNLLFLAVYDAVAFRREDAGWLRLAENGRCFKRQAAYSGDHVAIAQAIGARDGERAAQAMHAHLRDVQQHVLQHAFALPASA